MSVVLAYITTGDKAEAKKIGTELVKQKLAACVNILDGMESVYWWEGKIEQAKECVLVAKTQESLAPLLIEAVKKLHGYSCPCILTFPVSGGNEDYLRWLLENTQSK